MGTYHPAKKGRTRTLAETLAEAEEDHFLDCPNAEISYRVAAGLLDTILAFLALSGIEHICNALVAPLDQLGAVIHTHGLWQTLFQEASLHSLDVCVYLMISLKVSFSYFYFVWSLAYAGGSPGKLLVGLRAIDGETGQKLSFPRALAREGVGKVLSISLFGLGLLPILLRKDRKAFHDLLVSSVVKRIHGGLR